MGAVLTRRIETRLLSQTDSGAPESWELPDQGRNLGVVILFTDVPGTLQALRYAANLPYGERAPIRLLVPHVVPFPLPLHKPPVPASLLAQRFRTIAEKAGVETEVDILFCRDPEEAVRHSLATPHLVVIGGRRRWWPTREERIAKRLRADGHYVVLTESK